MGIRLKSGEKVAKGIRRVARNEMDAIIEHLESRRLENEAESVHEARKNLKKVRAVIRLVRGELGERLYKRENRRLREVGRALSPQRDAEVLVKTLGKLPRGSSVRSYKSAISKLDRVLIGRHQQAFESGNGTASLRPLLKTAQRHAAHWPLQKLHWADLCSGLGESYRRGRKAFKAASRDRTDENLHTWRKRVKDLWYQLRLVQCVCPKAICREAAEMKRLSEYLGDDHDLAMLTAAARGARLAPQEVQALLRWIAGHREELQSAAFDLGQMLYAEKPSRFAERVESYWNPGRCD